MGKSLYDNNMVVLQPGHQKYHIALSFNSSEEANNFYDSFDYEKQSVWKHRIKIGLCKHESESAVDVGSALHHYIVCPVCGRAKYVNDETPEELAARWEKARKNLMQREIKEMELDIEETKHNLAEKKQEYEEKYGVNGEGVTSERT